ncbi:MAG: hypothetical protein ACOY58_07820 [Candidatus Micrarchaeota archaeon]
MFIEIPVVKEVGREIVLQLPGGKEAAVNKRLLSFWRYENSAIRLWIGDFPSRLVEGFREIIERISCGGNGFIPVKVVGKGPTEKSKKVKVAGVEYRHSETLVETREHTLTIPSSQIQEVEAQHYVPRWLLKKAIHKRVLKGKSWPDFIGGGVCIFERELWNSVFAPVEEELKRQAEAQARQRKLLAEENEKRRVAMEAQREAEAPARAAAEEARSKKEEQRKVQKARHRAGLERVHVDVVEWDEWIQKKNKFGSKTREKETYVGEDCTLYFSGQRVYIVFPDGEEIIKARQNVRWGEALAAAVEPAA